MSDTSNENEAVFSSATLMLGEIHWHLLRASHLMFEKAVVKTKGAGFVVQEGYTDFGREVGRDEINWWVFKKEPQIEELSQQTTRALEAAQQLKKRSELLKAKNPQTHADLLKIFRQFAEDHAAEINTLYQFVLWLATRNILASTILYTYRVWGSTRRGDREFELDLNEAEPKPETVMNLTEIVLGLTSNRLPVMFRAEMEIGADMYERMTFQYSVDRAFAITELYRMHRKHKIKPEQFQRFSQDVLGMRRMSSAGATDPVKPGEVGPNGYPVGYNKQGDKVEWLPDEEHPEKKWAMILRRSDNAIHAAYEEFWDKVWWNRHQNWLFRIKTGEEPLKKGQEAVLATARKAARRIERKYGRKNLSWDDFQWGMLSGKLSALAWVTGAEWNESLDT